MRALRTFLLAALLLAACAPAATPPPTATATFPPPTPTAPPPTATPSPPATDTPGPTATPSPSIGRVTYRILQEETEARFLIDEILRGQLNTVVGVTNLVEGEITVDFDNPAASTIGPITIDAGSFVTDDSRRNSAIRRFILQTATYPTITFTPTAIDGLPEVITLGQPVDLRITGDLTIRDITQSVTFEATVTPVSAERLEGSARTVIQRGDFNLTIPSVSFIAEVAEEVTLEIDFVAVSP